MDKPEHTTVALSVKGPSALAIVLAGIASADRTFNQYEERQKSEQALGHHFPTNYFEKAASRQNDVYYGLLDVMPYLPADGLAEAAAQVGQALCVISCAEDEMPENEKGDHVYKKMQDRVKWLLHSAIRAMEKSGGFSLREMGLSTIRNDHQDPWADVTDIVARIEADRAA